MRPSSRNDRHFDGTAETPARTCMTRNYQRELSALSEVYATAMQFDINAISSMVASLVHCPLLTVGSGGSYSVASFAADLHQRRTGYISRAATPFEVVSGGIPRKAAAVCFSASGNNRDICVAFELLAREEAGPVGALVLSDETALNTLQSKYMYTNVVGGGEKAFKDGFLSVATILASSVLLTRAYDEVLGVENPLPPNFHELSRLCANNCTFDSLLVELEPVMSRPVTSILYSPIVRSFAIDLESRFVEAALGSLHVSDFRNFGHGRHHWMAKRSEETGVLAIISDKDQPLADRTLKLLPADIPVSRIVLYGPLNCQAIAGLVLGLFVTKAAGDLSGIDPGKPGVPKFGRELYRLGPGPLDHNKSALNRRAAIKRKAPEAVHESTQFELWAEAHKSAINRITDANYGGIVFDYDGTICDNRHRFNSLPQVISDSLCSLLDNKIKVGIATGRGSSAGLALRQCLPQRFWDDITVGYYNGAVVTTLSNENDELTSVIKFPELAKALAKHPLFTTSTIRCNEAQISIRLPAKVRVSTAISVGKSLLADSGISGRISASSHAIDILFTDASKTNVVEALQEDLNEGMEVLRIGDKGLWPGNDWEFLDSPYGLSVDEASQHLVHCWALAPAGFKGIQATLFYLSRINVNRNSNCFRLAFGKQGNLYAP